MIPQYRFFLQVGASGAMQSASPVYGGNLALNYELEQGQRFFRAKLNGKLTFYREDYDTIIAAPFGTVFYLYMEKSTDPAGLTFAPYYKSKFTITDCTVNVDDSIITVQPQTTDQYDEVLAGMDNEYNLITLAPAMNGVTISKRPLVQVYEAGADFLNCYIAGTSWEQDCTANANKNELGHIYWFGIDTVFTKFEVDNTLNYGSGYLSSSGNLVENSDFIYSTEFVPVQAGDVITWKYSSNSAYTDACLLLYNSSKQRIHYYNAYLTAGQRDITVPDDGSVYVRASFFANYKNDARLLVNGTEEYRPMDNSGYQGVYSGKLVRTGIHTSGAMTYEDFDATFENDNGATDYYVKYDLSVRTGWYEDYWFGTISVIRRAGGAEVTVGQHLFTSDTFNSGEYKLYGNGGNFYAYIDNIFMMARWLTDAASVEGITLYDLPVDDIAGENKNYHKAAQVSVGCCYVSTDVSSTPNEWGIAEDTGTYYFAPPSQLAGDWVLPVAQSAWYNRRSYWFDYDDVFQFLENKGVASYTLRNAYPIWSCISVLLAQMSSVTFAGTSTYSEFLYAATNPVSGTAVKLFVTPKSNILAGEYSVPAQKAMTTLGKFLQMLKNVYQCYWFIDASNRLRIEHISWFKNGGSYSSTPTVGIDLTELLEKRNATAWAYGVNEYTYEKSDMPQRYQFEWMDDARIPFNGEAIEVLSPAVNEGQVESVSVGDFSSDLDYMFLNPSVFSQDGFALLGATGSGNSWSVPFITYVQQGITTTLQNGYLAYVHLQPYYWVYDMPAKYVKINGVVYSLAYVSRRKQQRVTVPLGASDPDFLKLVKTNIGNGEIRAVSIPLSSRVAQVTLNYDTE